MRYVHTNLIVRDVERAIAFYQEAMGCVPAPPPRDLEGEWLARGTGVKGAALRGMHLFLPGVDGPTLEIYTYAELVDAELPVANRVGFGHLAFEVEDVEVALERVRAHGGEALGEIVVSPVPGVGLLTFTYARDPEGNILELQHWDRNERDVDARALYDAWAERYESDDNATREVAGRELRALLPPLEGQRVAELGCGPGNNTEALVSAASVVALDFSPAMLARARAAIAADNVRFVEHDLNAPLPLDDATVDVVVVSLVLEHIEELAPFYRECARVLDAGGTLLVLELHPTRQRAGKRARLEAGGEVIAAPAYLHPVSEHLSAALDAGMTLAEIREVGGTVPGAEVRAGTVHPRVLALRLTR